jgi:hypothetical protein
MSRKPKDKADYSSAKAARRALGDAGFVPRPNDLLASPLWHEMTLNGHRALMRIELEHARHTGKENGYLMVSYQQFVECGISRRLIRPTLELLCRLGLVLVTHHGHYPNNSSEYRLTYLPWKHVQVAGSPVYLQPTHEWRRYVPPLKPWRPARKKPKLRVVASSFEAAN